jgi:type II secretory pathway pseudopilin PulG
MEIILAIVVFGVLGAITIYGYRDSERAARERSRGNFDRGHTMAAVSGAQDQTARTP